MELGHQRKEKGWDIGNTGTVFSDCEVAACMFSPTAPMKGLQIHRHARRVTFHVSSGIRLGKRSLNIEKEKSIHKS
jgi:hypothetical protein